MGDAGFFNATDPWSLNYDEHPQLALLPVSASDVSAAVRSNYIIVKYRRLVTITQIAWTNQFDLDFAIRSGGITSSQSPDVIISLSKLNK